MPEEKFEYAYSAPTEKERKEIESILREYSPEKGATADKLARLRSLDKKVKLVPNITAWVGGIIGLLVFGGGLSVVLELSNYYLGIPLSLAGLAMMICAYPLYKLLYRRNKSKYGGEILALSKELLSAGQKENAELR